MSKLIKFIDFEEFKKLYKAEKNKKYKLAYALGFGSGLRISEVIGGTRKDGTIIPPLNKDKVDLEEHQIRIEGAKGKKDRITVTSPLLNETNIKQLPLKIKRRTLQYHISKSSQRVLKKKISFHTLRHGFGNYMVNDKNTPLPVVQQLLGHSRISTTGIYTKANPKQAIAKAWEAFGG